MIRFLMSAALVGLMCVTPALAKVDKVTDVAVTIDLAAINNKAAALRYTHIADDLKTAIVVLLVGRMSDTGSKVAIDISAVELSNSYTETMGTAETRLVGNVKVKDPANANATDSVTLTVDVNQVKTFLPPATDLATLNASSDVYYKALIQAFATAVVAHLDK